MIHNGIIFVPHSGNTEALDEFLEVKECGFKDLFTYLSAFKLGICDNEVYEAFKNSEYFGYERANFDEYLEANKQKDEK